MTRGTEAIAYIETEARRLARSGSHYGWRSIESALLDRNLTGVRKVFANRWTQFELDRLCAKACSEQTAKPLRHMFNDALTPRSMLLVESA